MSNEKLDIKTSLREDQIVFKNLRESAYDTFRREYSIRTIEEFINYDFNSHDVSEVCKYKYGAVQNVLRYAYLGEPLKHEELLDRKYSASKLSGREYRIMFQEFNNDLKKLGYVGYNSNYEIRGYLEKKYSKGDYDISLMDFVKYKCSFMMEYSHIKNSIPISLLKFYLKYYNEKINNKEDLSQSDITVDLLKSELADLITIRDSFNEKIDKLSEKIKYLEEKQAKKLKITLKDE